MQLNECSTKLAAADERVRRAEGLLSERDAQLAVCRRQLQAAERHLAVCTVPALELVSSLCRTATDMGVAPLHPAVPKLLSLLPPPPTLASSCAQTQANTDIPANSSDSSAALSRSRTPIANRYAETQNLSNSTAFPGNISNAKQPGHNEPTAGGPVRLIDLVANRQHSK